MFCKNRISLSKFTKTTRHKLFINLDEVDGGKKKIVCLKKRWVFLDEGSLKNKSFLSLLLYK